MDVNLVQFPLTVSEWGKAVSYMTDVIVGRNGQEVRNSLWQDPLMTFNAAFSIKSYSDIQTLTTFFHAMRGREKAFLVKDYADFVVTEWTTFKEAANGTRTTFQLFKPYTQTIGVTSSTYERLLKFVKTDTVTAQINGSPTTAFTVNASTGIVTFTSAPANGATVQFKIGEFYVPARFDIDELPIEMLNYWVQSGAVKSQVNVPEIPIREVRV
jgi:uncharacterized protein (TIGR02217 family)